jgi:hypothetical protein
MLSLALRRLINHCLRSGDAHLGSEMGSCMDGARGASGI